MNPFRHINKLDEAILKPGAIEAAVESFVKDSHTEETHADPVGLYNQTIEVIAHATIFQHDDTRQFWIADEDGDVKAYALCHISKDVDNQLCFWITQAYVHPSCRRTPQVKQWMEQLRAEAKRLLCKHIVMPSSRSTKAYIRFLGHETHQYCVLLKQDI